MTSVRDDWLKASAKPVEAGMFFDNIGKGIDVVVDTRLRETVVRVLQRNEYKRNISM